ncbi:MULTISPECIES: hypothetical protein [Sphingomonas]|jgi:hypothetical protein|uniref:Uncharacterized protein n=1 Tax=Sphingomonas zeae TaxID=1646122 RepID=A0A7Y6EGE9_9SPHN|nr:MULTISPECIES: hypothetical protein [Sphingomonas]MBB4049646.1 hypothetical protein [Sphingomonas zeae]MDK8187841.1 hypothetical protein [Sphingomonas zeae]MDK8217695.1 hypothetical protein [Sphingomonas sp. UMB7805-LC452B]NUU46027.1 hypothetical protein [Sphingomonas zeae]
MVAFSTIKPGDRLFQVRRVKMGNTTMSRDAVYTVVIKEVHDRYAIASWNGNTADRWYPEQIAKLRRTEPKRKPDIFERAMSARKALGGGDER